MNNSCVFHSLFNFLLLSVLAQDNDCKKRNFIILCEHAGQSPGGMLFLIVVLYVLNFLVKILFIVHSVPSFEFVTDRNHSEADLVTVNV